MYRWKKFADKYGPYAQKWMQKKGYLKKANSTTTSSVNTSANNYVRGFYGLNWTPKQYIPKGLSVKQQAKIAYMLAKKNANRKERKYIDTTATDQAITSTASAGPLNLCAQGATDITRNGDKCNFLSLSFRYHINVNSSRTTKSETVRIVICIEKNVNGVSMDYDDLFAAETIESLRNMSEDKLGNYKILYDRTISLGLTEQSGAQDSIYKKFDIVTYYNGSAGTIATLQRNGIYLLTLGTEETNGALLDYHARLRFTDS